jgi:hypothetical protein
VQRKRRGKFAREVIRKIALTERDTGILLALHKYRFLTSDHLMLLTNTASRWGMNKRLRLLYDHKYLDRPKAQHALFSHASKRPTIYALGHKGASLLRARFGIAMPGSVYWTEKNRRVREHYLQHTLGIADFMVEMELHCRSNPTLRLIDRDEILACSPEHIRKSRYPFRWTTHIRHGSQILDAAIAPDYVFGIETRHSDGSLSRKHYCLEFDRATMPIMRRDLRQSSIQKKLLCYADSFERKLLSKRYGWSGFQILFVTISEDRIASMQSAVASLSLEGIPASLFLFREQKAAQATLPFLKNWRNTRGSPAKLG